MSRGWSSSTKFYAALADIAREKKESPKVKVGAAERAAEPRVRCYVCGQQVPKSQTDLLRHRVPSGVVRTPSAFTYRFVRKCVPPC